MDEQFQRYFDEMPCCGSVHDRELCIVDGNRRFREEFGDRIGERCYRVYMRREEVCPECPVEMTFADGQSRIAERTLVNRDGVEVRAVVHITPLRGEDGEIESVMETHTDMSEVVQLQERLERSRGRLARLFDIVPCYLSVQGPDLVIRDANHAFRERFGPAVGRPCYRVFKNRDEPCRICPARSTFEDGLTREHEEVITAADGESIHVLCTTAPIYDSVGRVVAIIEMATDISQLHRLRSRLTSIGLLVGSVSHEVKGLLTGLDGGIYLVTSGFERDDPARVKRGWEMVRRNVARVRTTVLDILHHAKDRDLDLDRIELAPLAEEIHRLLRKRAAEIDVELGFDVPAEVGAFPGDREAIRTMLVNVLESSLESCRIDPSGRPHEVRLSARRAPPWMDLEVEDNGRGMDRESEGKQFSLFFASEESREARLELFVSNEIAKKHGGYIELHSQPGRGSRFRIRLPLEARPSTLPREAR